MQKKKEEEIKDQEQEAKDQATKEDEPKSGIEILKDIGLKNVSNKTFINLENLTYLLDKDFEKLHKTKALGFIQILERDFDVDLSELREDYLAHLNGGRKISSKKRVESKKSTETKTPKNIKQNPPIKEKNFKIGPYLLIIMAALLAYLLFKNATKEDEIKFDDLNTQSEHLIKEPEKNLIEEATLNSDESNESQKDESEDDDIDLNKVVHEMLQKEKDESDTNLTQIVQNTDDSTLNLNSGTNTSTKSTDIPTLSQELPQTKETNSSDKAYIQQNSSTVNSLEEIENQKVSNIDNTNTDTNKIDNQLEKEQTESNTNQLESPINQSLYIKPIQKAWVGVIYLDNYTKKDYLIRNTLKLDPSRDQIILVGHNKFKIYRGDKEAKFHSKRMVRFLYKNGTLKEINKKEYINASKGVRW